eukprot:ANDGO_00339.mRNA.1 hypothetical protein
MLEDGEDGDGEFLRPKVHRSPVISPATSRHGSNDSPRSSPLKKGFSSVDDTQVHEDMVRTVSDETDSDRNRRWTVASSLLFLYATEFGLDLKVVESLVALASTNCHTLDQTCYLTWPSAVRENVFKALYGWAHHLSVMSEDLKHKSCFPALQTLVETYITVSQGKERDHIERLLVVLGCYSAPILDYLMERFQFYLDPRTQAIVKAESQQDKLRLTSVIYAIKSQVENWEEGQSMVLDRCPTDPEVWKPLFCHHDIQIKTAIAETLLAVCGGDPDLLVQIVGIGNASWYISVAKLVLSNV